MKEFYTAAEAALWLTRHNSETITEDDVFRFAEADKLPVG